MYASYKPTCSHRSRCTNTREGSPGHKCNRLRRQKGQKPSVPGVPLLFSLSNDGPGEHRLGIFRVAPVKIPSNNHSNPTLAHSGSPEAERPFGYKMEIDPLHLVTSFHFQFFFLNPYKDVLISLGACIRLSDASEENHLTKYWIPCADPTFVIWGQIIAG